MSLATSFETLVKESSYAQIVDELETVSIRALRPFFGQVGWGEMVLVRQRVETGKGAHEAHTK